MNYNYVPAILRSFCTFFGATCTFEAPFLGGRGSRFTSGFAGPFSLVSLTMPMQIITYNEYTLSVHDHNSDTITVTGRVTIIIITTCCFLLLFELLLQLLLLNLHCFLCCLSLLLLLSLLLPDPLLQGGDARQLLSLLTALSHLLQVEEHLHAIERGLPLG